PELLDLDLGLVGEVESELLVVYQRALLVDVVAKHLSQGVVENMGAGVVVADGGPPELVILADDLVSGRELAILDVTAVEDVATVLLDVHDLELGNVVDDDSAGVGDLTTGFGIEV